MPEGDLTPEQAAQLVGSPPNPAQPLLPMSAAQVAAMGTSGSAVNVPPEIGDTRRRQQALGEQPGVPFHEEGLPTWTDLMAKSRENKDAQIRYLARKFGTENVRLNEFQEPVVRITNPDTGKPEDYPLNPHQLTVRNLTSLARFAPDVAGAIVAVGLGGAGRGTFMKSLLGALGAETGGATREIGVEAATMPLSSVEIARPIKEHLENIPADVILDLGLAGLVKGGQVAKGLLTRGSIPNPIAGTPLTMPARPEFTREGTEAAARLQAASGINPALRPSESTGIPLMAMLEMYMERKPAGASPLIAAGARREEASKAIQNWLVDPSTLMSDEEVGRRALGAIKKTVEPHVQAVEAAKAALEQETKDTANLTAQAQKALVQGQQAKIVSGMRVSQIPDQGVDLKPAGDLLRTGAVQRRDAFKSQANALYDAFYANPKANERVISGDTLKAEIDSLRNSLPAVEKTVQQPSKLLDPSGNPVMIPVAKEVPISTPIRPRLDELSAKLAGGKVSINDLKQVRTDLDDAIKIGEAIPGVKEGRLKRTYKAVTDAINQGLQEIGDPQLSQAWKDATTFYRQNVDKYTEKNVARLFKEAEQTASVGDAEFTKKAITSPDTYAALRTFYGVRSPEMGVFRETVKNKVLSDSLGVGGLVDGQNLVRQLKGLKDSNPGLFKDVFAGKGNDFLRAAEQLGSWQQKIPIEEINKLLSPGGQAGAPSVKLIALQAAQKRLDQEYQNEIVSKFLRGNLPASELQPDKFVASLPQAKLSDVKDVMARLTQEDPAVAEQIRRKSVQNLLSESRRTATPVDTMAKLKGEPGDLISGVGVANALGKGDQLEKYKALLGPLYDHLNDYARMELLGEERRRVAGGVGLLAPGSAMNMFVKALTPWEGAGNKAEGVIKELSGLARDKIVSVALSSDRLRNWLVSPYALKDASKAIQTMIVSEPFIKGMMEEFKDTGALGQAMSILKVGFGTASETPTQRQGDLSPEEAQRLVPR